MSDLLEQAVKPLEGERPETLYEMTNEALALFHAMRNAAEEGEGEIPENLLEKHDAAVERLEDKVESYGRVMRNLEAEAEQQDALEHFYQDLAKPYLSEAEKYGAQAKALRNNVDRMKARLHESLRALDADRVDTEHFKFWRQRTTPRVELLVPEDDLPEQFQRVKRSADKTKLKTALEQEDPEATKIAKLEQGETLRWK